MKQKGYLLFVFLIFIMNPSYATFNQTLDALLCNTPLLKAAIELHNTQWKAPEKINPNFIRLEWDHYCPKCTLENQHLCAQRSCEMYNIAPSPYYENIQVKSDDWIRLANQEALKSVQDGGGPFAAVILQIDDESGKIIRYWIGHNHVAEQIDPTAHAEMTTIRSAAKELGVLNLGHIHKNESKLSQPSEWSHCIIYSSAEPCPMCMSAIYWAGIKQTIFAATQFDAAIPGVNFSDLMIQKELNQPYDKRKAMQVLHANTNNSLDAFNYYKRNNVARYGALSHSTN